jgi:hypothetical protein
VTRKFMYPRVAEIAPRAHALRIAAPPVARPVRRAPQPRVPLSR